MSRIVTEAEMNSRRAMVAAKCDITAAMASHSLTAIEWVNVLAECQQRMILHGLAEQYSEETSAEQTLDG